MPEQIPIIDWNDLAIEFLPQSHRTPRFIAWFQGMTSGSIGYINNNFYNYMYGDENSEIWNNSITYQLNDTVKDYFGVYISLQNGNINNPTQSSPLFWYKIAPSYIGAQERAQYCAQKLIMEFALNRWFFTNFKQPTALTNGTSSGQWYTPISDIWIQTKSPNYLSFQFQTLGENNKSNLYTQNNGSFGLFTSFIDGTNTTYEYIVWIPTSLTSNLGANYLKIISSVVVKMGIEGTEFTIQTY